MQIETIELARGGKSYTYDTMKELTQNNPDTDYYFIIGGDMVEYLPKWYKIDELTSMVNFGYTSTRIHNGYSISCNLGMYLRSTSVPRKYVKDQRRLFYPLPCSR